MREISSTGPSGQEKACPSSSLQQQKTKPKGGLKKMIPSSRKDYEQRCADAEAYVRVIGKRNAGVLLQ